MTTTDPAPAAAAARTGRRLGDGIDVHPAVRDILNALQDLAGYQPTSAADAAALMLSIGGDGTGTFNIVNEAIEALGVIARHPAITTQVTTGAAMYVQAATEHITDRWQGTGGEIANGEAIRIIGTDPSIPVPDFHQQFLLYDHTDD